MEEQSSFQIPINLSFMKFINFQDFPERFARFQDFPEGGIMLDILPCTYGLQQVNEKKSNPFKSRPTSKNHGCHIIFTLKFSDFSMFSLTFLINFPRPTRCNSQIAFH